MCDSKHVDSIAIDTKTEIERAQNMLKKEGAFKRGTLEQRIVVPSSNAMREKANGSIS
jgi:hypothetical protein